MAETSLEYFRRRREQELSLQAAAVSSAAASAHEALALVYAEEVRRLTTRGPHLRLIVSHGPRRIERGEAPGIISQ